MGRSYYNNASKFAEQEVINYATKNTVSIAQIAERMEIKDTELFCIIHNSLSQNKKVEIKRIIDDIVKEREESEKTVSLEDLVFVHKELGRRSEISKKDIGISAHKKSDRNKLVVKIVFRKGIDKIIAPSGYAIAAYIKGRIYIKDATANMGYALTQGRDVKTENRYCALYNVPQDFYDAVREKGGEFDALFDDKLKLYYIQVE